MYVILEMTSETRDHERYVTARVYGPFIDKTVAHDWAVEHNVGAREIFPVISPKERVSE